MGGTSPYHHYARGRLGSKVLDNELLDDQDWFDSLPATPLLFPLFDEQGMLRPHVLVQQHNVQTLPLVDDASMAILTEDECDIHKSTNCCVYYANLHCTIPFNQLDILISGSNDADDEELLPCITVRKAHLVTLTKQDYKSLHSNFAWLPADIVWKTFGGTMQFACMPYNTILRHCYKAPHPALNHFCREEPIATDTIVSNTRTIDGGETWAQLCIGTKSLLLDAYGMKTPANFSSTLMDNITQQGAPTLPHSLAIEPRLRSANVSKKSCILSLLEHGKAKPTSSTRILPNAIIKTSRRW